MACLVDVDETVINTVDGERLMCPGSDDSRQKVGVITIFLPGWNLLCLSAVSQDHILSKRVQENVLPGDKNGRVLILFFLQFFFESFNFLVRKLCIDRQTEPDSGWFNGH